MAAVRSGRGLFVLLGTSSWASGGGPHRRRRRPRDSAARRHAVSVRPLLAEDRRPAGPAVGAASSTTSGCPAPTCGATCWRRSGRPGSTRSRCTSTGPTTRRSRACTTSPAYATWTGCCGIAEELGLYVIARPGTVHQRRDHRRRLPRLAEERAGPGPQSARRATPPRTATGCGHINPIIARAPGHPRRLGDRSTTPRTSTRSNTDAAYMEDLQDQARADGIDVPITHNDCCDAASWTSTWATGPGAVQIPGVDDYPQSFDCPNPDDVGPVGRGRHRAAARRRAGVRGGVPGRGDRPVGGAGLRRVPGADRPGLHEVLLQVQPHRQRRDGVQTTTWPSAARTGAGWRSPTTSTPPTTTARRSPRTAQLTAKYDEFKRQGYFLASGRAADRDRPGAPRRPPTTPPCRPSARANPDTGTQFVLVRHADRASATADDSATLDWRRRTAATQVPVRLARPRRQGAGGRVRPGRPAARLVQLGDHDARRASAAGTSRCCTAARATPGSTVLRYSVRAVGAGARRVGAGVVRRAATCGWTTPTPGWPGCWSAAAGGARCCCCSVPTRRRRRSGGGTRRAGAGARHVAGALGADGRRHACACAPTRRRRATVEVFGRRARDLVVERRAGCAVRATSSGSLARALPRADGRYACRR